MLPLTYFFDDTPFDAIIELCFLLLPTLFTAIVLCPRDFEMLAIDRQIYEVHSFESRFTSPRFAMSQARGRLMIHGSLSCSLNKTCGSRIAGAVGLAKSC
jgi:hypothetical protein